MGDSLLTQIESAEPPAHDQPTAIERLILKHAMRSFGERGYAATTLRSIAADARVTAPMVSYYFKSKEGLFQHLAEIVMASLESAVRTELSGDQSFFDAVEAVARAHVELARRSPSAVEFLCSLLWGPRDGRPSPDIDAMYQGTRAMIREVFEQGIRTGEFRPRAGMTVGFLVDQLGTLLQDHVSRRIHVTRACQRHPDGTSGTRAEPGGHDRCLELALRHFFFGAGDVPALESA